MAVIPTLLLLGLQALDITLHIATDQFEPIRILSNVIISGGVIWMALSERNARSIAIVSGALYLLLNLVFLIQNGIINPATDGLRLPLFAFVIFTLLLLVWCLKRTQKTES